MLSFVRVFRADSCRYHRHCSQYADCPRSSSFASSRRAKPSRRAVAPNGTFIGTFMPLLAFLTSATVISIFIIPVLLIRRDGYRRAQDYFVSSDHILPKVIQNSSIAYAIGLATFGPFFAWGASGDFWPAIVHAAFFGLGL